MVVPSKTLMEQIMEMIPAISSAHHSLMYMETDRSSFLTFLRAAAERKARALASEEAVAEESLSASTRRGEDLFWAPWCTGSPIGASAMRTRFPKT